MFSGGGIESKKAVTKSGIERFGWYGSILSLANSILDVKDVKRILLYDFMDYLSYKKAEFKMNNPDETNRTKR